MYGRNFVLLKHVCPTKSYSLSATSYLLIATSLLLIANLFIFTSPVFAVAADPDCKVLNVGDWCPLGEKNYNDEISVQRFTRNILVSSHVALSGTNPLGGNVYQEHAMADKQGNLSYVPGISPGNTNTGALAMTSTAIASLYNPPTSSIEYLANLGENLGLAPKPAYAQEVGGSGASVITPVLKIWQVTRNISYVAFILVFVAAGIMIMFRQKLNPQTVIGIQQALPGIVIGLILVTFSYFIAALMVDLSFVGTRLVAELFISTNQKNYFGCTVLDSNRQICSKDPESNKKELENTANNSDALQMYAKSALRINNVNDILGQVWGSLSPKSSDALTNSVTEWWQTMWWNSIPKGKGVNVGKSISAVVGMFQASAAFFGQSAIAGTGAILGAILIPLILMIALMIQFIKLIIALVMSYLQILLMVIFGPILIMVSAIPGRGGILNYWLKSLLANALVFPAVFAGFLFAGMLLEWDAGALKGATMPLFGGLSPDVLKSVLAFGVLLGLPSIPDMVREAFGVKAPQGFMQAAVGGFMGGVTGARTGYSQGMQQSGLQGRKEAMEKGRLEKQSQTYYNNEGRPRNRWEWLLSKAPGAGR